MRNPTFDPREGIFDNHRILDSLGRVHIPEDIRKALGWEPFTRMECLILDSRTRAVCVRPERLVCCFCGGEREIHLVKRALVCLDCMHELRRR